MSPAPQPRSIEITRRQMTAALALVSLAWLMFALHYAWLGRWRTVQLDLAVGAATLVALAWARHSERGLAMSGHLALALSAAGLVVASLISGQGAAMSLWFLVCIPLFAAVHYGRHATVAWGLVAGVAAGMVHVWGEASPIEPEFVAAGPELLAGQWILVTVAALIAALGRRAHDEQLEAAAAAAASKQRFLASMSHELRTPLNSVVGMSELLAATELDPRQRELASALRRGGLDILGVFEQVMRYARDGALVPGDRRRPTDVVAVVDDVLDLFASSAQDCGLRLESAIGEAQPRWFSTDPDLWRHALISLVGHAVRVAQAGVVEVRITITPAGLASTVQYAGPRPAVGAGGADLALAQTVADALQGALEVREVAGAVTLQLTVPGEGVPTPSHGEPPAGTGFAAQRAGAAPATPHALGILVVDDDPANLAVCTAMLAQLGYDAETANDGLAALDLVGNRRFDLVLLDLNMPGLSGFEVAERIGQTLEPRARPRIVAHTANTDIEHRRRAAAAGMDDFLEKPLTLDALRAAIERGGAAPTCPSTTALDELWAMVGPDIAAWRELLGVARDNLEQRSQAAQNAVGAKQWSDLAREAHSVRGTAATFGSPALGELCASLEAAAHAGDERLCTELTARFVAECSTAARLLQRHMDIRAGQRPASTDDRG